MTCLLDTNILSEFTKRQIDTRVLAWWNVHRGCCKTPGGTGSSPSAVALERDPPICDERFCNCLHRENDYVSAVTIGEVQYGICRLPEGSARRKRLEKWLVDDVLGCFGECIVPYTPEVAQIWGRIIAAQEGAGTSKPDLDMQIAATAICHNLTLVTRNVDDFEVPGLKVINPFV